MARRLPSRIAGALVLALAASHGAAARDAELAWVPGGGTAATGYKVFVRAPLSAYGEGVDIGMPTPDAQGVLRTTVTGLDDQADAYLALAAYTEEGDLSALSNELRSRAVAAGPPSLGEGARTLTIPDPALHPILDAAEGRLLDVDGLGIAYSVEMDGRGRLVGVGAADVDGDGAFETCFTPKGKLRGKDASLRAKLKLRFAAQLEGRTRVRAVLRRDVDVAGGVDHEQTDVRGKWQDEPLEALVEATQPTDPSALAWSLAFAIDEAGEERRKPTVGLLLYGEGEWVVLDGFAVANDETGTWKLRLSSSGETSGIRVKLDDAALGPGSVDAGRLRYKAFGQKGSLEL